ncbi:MAG TPA: glycoside hydrolase family 2 TIM barrel-domain containing protein [Candidatus Koribacter sp.]|jgi:beta-glucuronidase
MQRALKLAVVLACSIAAVAQNKLIANIAARNPVSLDGPWHAIVDAYKVGEHSRFYEDRKPKDLTDPVEYDFDRSPTLNVPGDWNSQSQDLHFYEGAVWYRRIFTAHPARGKRQFLYFGAANYRALVYLNSEKLGEHIGGFTPFNFEVTGKLHDGENLVVVEVDNRRERDGIPALNTDWWNYGGLTRDVELVEVPATFIENYFVQFAKGSLNEIAGWVQLNGSEAKTEITLEIPEAKFRQTMTTDQRGRAEFHFRAQLTPWSPENPKLYKVTLSTANDQVQDEIAFRSIEARGAKLYLNDKPIFLRGVSIHEEAPFRDARAITSQDDAALLGWAKELGCNYVRLAHYPHHESMVREAERMGLMVWSEIPVYWDIDFKNPATLALARQQLREEIERDQDRGAIILWSIANETPISTERMEFLKTLAADGRSMDPTRLITAASNRFERQGNKRLVNDPLGEIVDVLAVNEYIGWYEGKAEDLDSAEWKTAWDKPLIFSEFGGGALAGRHGAQNERWTEEFQANIYRHQIAMFRRTPLLAGLSPWILMDFQSPVRLQPGVQDMHNRKGLVSNQGTHKQAFFILQDYYRELAKSSSH